MPLNNGIVNIGDGNNVLQIYDGGTLQVDGGTLNLYGRLSTSNGTTTNNAKFIMTGGDFNIDPQRIDVGGSNLGQVDVFQIY